MSKIFIGTVTSVKTKNTVTILVERKLRHPVYKKVIRRHKKYKVHFTDIDLKEGDLVEIKETRPISKDKHFVIVKKIK